MQKHKIRLIDRPKENVLVEYKKSIITNKQDKEEGKFKRTRQRCSISPEESTVATFNIRSQYGSPEEQSAYLKSTDKTTHKGTGDMSIQICCSKESSEFSLANLGKERNNTV